MSVKEFITKYNLWISILLGAVVGPLLTYLYSGQVFTWSGMIAAVLSGVVSYFTTEKARDQGQVEGFQTAKKSPTDF